MHIDPKQLVPDFKQPSTWRGAVFLLSAFGIVIEPAQQEAIVSLGMALAGFIGVFVSDPK
jgi:hypothetical protein